MGRLLLNWIRFCGLLRCGLHWRSVSASLAGMPNRKDVQDCAICNVPCVQSFRRPNQGLRDICRDGQLLHIAHSVPVSSHRLWGFCSGHIEVQSSRGDRRAEVLEADKANYKNQGDMSFARFGNMCFVQWKDSKPVQFLTTIHIFATHFVPRSYR